MATDGEKVTGKIERTSSYGIMIDGAWYNPHGKCKEYMSDAVAGATVELTMTGHKNDFRFIKVTESSNAQTAPSPASNAAKAPSGTSTGYWEERAERDKIKDVQISRHGAMNTAVSIMGSLDKGSDSSHIGQYFLQLSVIADLVLRYVQDDAHQETYADLMSGAKNTINMQKGGAQ